MSRTTRIAIVLLTALLAGCTTLVLHGRGAFLERTLATDAGTRRYTVFVPSREAGGRHPPVILFLHGSGERGNDGVKPTLAGLGPHVRAHADTFPAIVVFPQVPEGEEWQGDNAVHALAALDAATREFRGDPDRTYLTGMSMGGYGTWELALMQPRRFAALVPVCGAIRQRHPDRPLYVTSLVDEADPYAALAAKLSPVPTWIFHGARDDVVPPEDDRRLIQALRAAGAADARYTEFPDANHNAWDPAYAGTPELWEWLFAQRR